MRLKSLAAAEIIATVIDLLDGRLDLESAAAILYLRPDTLERVVLRVREIRSRRG